MRKILQLYFPPHPPHLKMVDSDPINTVQHSQKGQNLIQRWAGAGGKEDKEIIIKWYTKGVAYR